MATNCEAQFRQLVHAALWNKPVLPHEQVFHEHFESLTAEDSTAVFDVCKQAFFLAKSYTQADLSKMCEEPQLTAKFQALSELRRQRVQLADSTAGLQQSSQHPEQLAAQLRRKAKSREVAKLDLAVQQAQEQVKAAQAQLVLQQERMAEAVLQVEGKAEYLNKVSQGSVQWNRRPTISRQ